MAGRYPTSIIGVATTSERMYPCVITESINFISNDSVTYDMIINFDKSTDEGGGILIKKGESISDLNGVALTRIFVKAISGPVDFRVVGV